MHRGMIGQQAVGPGLGILPLLSDAFGRVRVLPTSRKACALDQVRERTCQVTSNMKRPHLTCHILHAKAVGP